MALFHKIMLGPCLEWSQELNFRKCIIGYHSTDRFPQSNANSKTFLSSLFTMRWWVNKILMTQSKLSIDLKPEQTRFCTEKFCRAK